MRLFAVPLLLLLLLVILSLWTINVASAARFVAPRPRPASADVSSWKDNQELLNVHLIPHSHCMCDCCCCLLFFHFVFTMANEKRLAFGSFVIDCDFVATENW